MEEWAMRIQKRIGHIFIESRDPSRSFLNSSNLSLKRARRLGLQAARARKRPGSGGPALRSPWACGVEKKIIATLDELIQIQRCSMTSSPSEISCSCTLGAEVGERRCFESVRAASVAPTTLAFASRHPLDVS